MRLRNLLPLLAAVVIALFSAATVDAAPLPKA